MAKMNKTQWAIARAIGFAKGRTLHPVPTTVEDISRWVQKAQQWLGGREVILNASAEADQRKADLVTALGAWSGDVRVQVIGNMRIIEKRNGIAEGDMAWHDLIDAQARERIQARHADVEAALIDNKRLKADPSLRPTIGEFNRAEAEGRRN